MVMPVAPRVPRAPERRRTFQREGREQRPFKIEIPLPPEDDERLWAEFVPWHEETNGSFPEFIVWKWLINEKRQRQNIDFYYQHPMFGGRTVYGGFLLDFFFPMKSMGWRVMGLRWHLIKPRDRARDLVSKQQLEGRGIHIVDLWEDDILNRREYTLEKAWRGFSLQPRRTAAL